MFIRLVIFSLAFSCVFLCSANDKGQKDKEKLPAETLAKMTYKELENNGVDYLLAEKFDLSQACFEEMLKREKAQKTPNPEKLVFIYYGLGRIAYEVKKNEEATKYFLNALEFSAKIKAQSESKLDLEILIYNSLTGIFRRKKDFDKALSYNNKALNLSIKIYGKGSSRTAAYMVINSCLLCHKHEHSKALSILENAYNILEKQEGKNKRITQRVYKLLVEWRNGNFQAELPP